MNKLTVELLEQHFDTAFSAPDGIKKLRELILTLAMQGKLVPQYPNDQPASELLKEIEEEKKRLVKEGKIKVLKSLMPVTTKEEPFMLPKSWEWVRLNDISIKIHYGYTASANHEIKTIRLLRITDIQDNRVDWKSVPGCEASKDDVSQYILANNDILIARTGGTVGKSYLVQDISVDAVFASYLIRVIPSTHIVFNYLKYSLESPLYWKQLYAACSGTGQPNVNGTSLSMLHLPLPPHLEQQRIVAKIDELMERCDAMEKLRTAQEEKRLAVHTSAIKQLLNIAEANEHLRAQDFLAKHFADLYTVKANVAELRKAILQLAVMGKLVPQDPNDPPASELLKEIEAEKKRLVKEGKIKASKPLPMVTNAEEPFMLPVGWTWVRLGNAMLKITDGTHHSPPNSDIGEFLYISAKNIKDDGVLVSNATYVVKEIHEEIYSRCNPEFGNILYIKDGATTGIVTINNLTQPFSMLSSVALLKQPTQINNRFLLYTLRSPFFYGEMRAGMTGVAITRVTLKILNDALIPLPPIAEQFRIVAKIDQLMYLCDSLDQQIDTATDKKNALLNAVMAEI